MNQKKFATLGLSGLLVLALVTGGFATGVSAETTEDCDALFNDCDDWVSLSNITSAASGLFDRVSSSVSIFSDDESVTAQDSADAVQTFFNSNSQSFVSEYNARMSADKFDEDVIVRLTFDDGDDRVSKFLYADFVDGELQSAEIVDTTQAGDVADEYIIINDYAQEESSEELENFHGEFIETGDSVTQSYISHKAAQFGGDIDASFDLKPEGDE